jgi:hypothetical protein
MKPWAVRTSAGNECDFRGRTFLGVRVEVGVGVVVVVDEEEENEEGE